MRIGYACLTAGVVQPGYRTCRMDRAGEGLLHELIQHNFNTLEQVIDYNIKNNIRLFRISSDIVPFGSSPVNPLPWWDIFDAQLTRIGNKINAGGMRVSMHPGQYTVINSDRPEVVQRAFADLEYHARVLDSLKLDEKNKIVLHIGGIYKNKEQAASRFKTSWHKLSDPIRKRLVVENDDKSYSISDVYEIACDLDVPVVFDNLHHRLNPGNQPQSDLFWIDECKGTWKIRDGPQKIHYAQQAENKRPGSHSHSIDHNQFLEFFRRINREDVDVMLEVKDKNLSAIKCIHCTSPQANITHLEVEWGRYKYKILENSQEDYNAIRKLLSDKSRYNPVAFYDLVDKALKREGDRGSRLNAVLHVWGYFKKTASESEKEQFFRYEKAYENGGGSLALLKKYLLKLAQKYEQKYLLDSYYFSL